MLFSWRTEKEQELIAKLAEEREKHAKEIAELQKQLAEQSLYRLEQLLKEFIAMRDEIVEKRKQYKRETAKLYEGPLFFSLTTGKERGLRAEHNRKCIKMLKEREVELDADIANLQKQIADAKNR